jgi:hypothetical protein
MDTTVESPKGEALGTYVYCAVERFCRQMASGQELKYIAEEFEHALALIERRALAFLPHTPGQLAYRIAAEIGAYLFERQEPITIEQIHAGLLSALEDLAHSIRKDPKGWWMPFPMHPADARAKKQPAKRSNRKRS